MFDTTILNNITFEFSKKEFDKEKIELLISNLALKDKISSLSNGINTNIGERGVSLSGGQIQRIGIARALYHKPKILILDESTNAIEKEIERKVLNYLKSIKSEMIIIIVAHRDSVFNFADEILELKNGKLFQIKI